MSDPYDPNKRSDDLYLRSVVFSPCGNFLATGAEDHVIRVWDIAYKRIKWAFKGHEQDIYSLDWCKDGRWLVSGSGDKTIKVWDVENGSCILKMHNEDDKVSPVFNPNSSAYHSALKDSGVTSVSVSPVDGQSVAAVRICFYFLLRPLSPPANKSLSNLLMTNRDPWTK